MIVRATTLPTAPTPCQTTVSQGVFACPGVTVSNHAALVTGAQAARLLHVDPATICAWVKTGRLTATSRRGRSPLYRWGDLLDAERATRLSPHSSRNTTRTAA